MTTSTEMSREQQSALQTRFLQTLKAFWQAREAMRDYLEGLPEDRFYYTEGYDPVAGNHDFAVMKNHAMAHILSYSVLKSGSSAHPSHAEYDTGIIFDGNPKPYALFDHARANMQAVLKEASPIRYYCAQSGFHRPIYYQWFAHERLPAVRVATFARQFSFVHDPCPYLTVGAWRNMHWLPVSRKLFDDLANAHPEHAVFLGKEPDLLSRQLSRVSCRAVLRDGYGERTTLSLTLPLIYAPPMRPKKFTLRHYLWTKNKASGRQLSAMQPIAFFSERYGIFSRV